MAIQLESADLGTTIADALDRVRRGEEVTIADHGRPIARIIPVGVEERIFGDFQGKVHMRDDFNAPLSEVELAEWEG